ncbi:MAG: glycosyltransferase [Halodesulfurarchaeum sp.]
MSGSLGIVVPAYRPDVDRLLGYIETLEAELEPRTIRVELDDPEPSTFDRLGSTTATVNAVESRRGKGRALTDGFDALDTAVLGFADADGSTPASSIRSIVSVVQDGQADVAVGSRRHPEADVRAHQTVFRHRLGDGFAWLARQVISPPLRDYQCGAKALTREVWGSVRPEIAEAGFAWDIEVIALSSAMSYEIREVPVTWIDHPESTVSTWAAVPEMLRALFRVRRRAKTIRGSDRGWE